MHRLEKASTGLRGKPVWGGIGAQLVKGRKNPFEYYKS